jgi:hypothetical protein
MRLQLPVFSVCPWRRGTEAADAAFSARGELCNFVAEMQLSGRPNRAAFE